MRAGVSDSCAAGAFDGTGDVLGDGCGELQEFAARCLQREAVFVVAARGIRAERRDAAAVGVFGGLRIPLAGGAVGFRGKPAFDVPAVELRIFGFVAEFHAFAEERAVIVAVLELAADPGQAIPAPDGAVVGFAKAVVATGDLQNAGDGGGWLVRFAEDDNSRLVILSAAKNLWFVVVWR